MFLMGSFLLPFNSMFPGNLRKYFFFMVYPLIQLRIMLVSSLKSQTFQCLLQWNPRVHPFTFPTSHIGYKINMQMWSRFILMQITAKYSQCRIPLLKILNIFIQNLHCKFTIGCSSSHIFTISNLKDDFMEQLFLLTLPDLLIIICNLPILLFSDIITLHRFIK